MRESRRQPCRLLWRLCRQRTRAPTPMPMPLWLPHWSVLPGALHASPLLQLPPRPRNIIRRLRRTRRGLGCGVPGALAPQEAAPRLRPGGAAQPPALLRPALLLVAGCAPPTTCGRATTARCSSTPSWRSCTCHRGASAHRPEPRERRQLRQRRRRGSLAARQPRVQPQRGPARRGLRSLGPPTTSGSATTAPWRRIPSARRWVARRGQGARLHREEGHGGRDLAL